MHPKVVELQGLIRKYRKPRSTDNIFVNYRDIAERFGLSKWRIKRHPTFPRLPCTRLMIERWIRDNPVNPNDRFLEDVKRLKAEGLPSDAIAWKLQISPNVVYRLWKLARRTFIS